MIVSGGFSTLKQSVSAANYVAEPFDEKKYNWQRKSYCVEDNGYELALLENIVVFSRSCIYHIESNSYISSMTYHGFYKKKFGVDEGSALELEVEPKQIELDSPVFILGGHNNYYHWIFNWLPRLLTLNRLCFKLGYKKENVKVLIDKEVPDSFRELIYQAGISRENLIEKDSSAVLVKKGLVSNFFNQHCYYPDVIKFYKEMNFGMHNNKNSAIYINRNRLPNSRRRIYNYIELSKVLLDHNVKVVTLEDLSVAQQAREFSAARIVVAPHGAGLTNLIFCDKATQVVIFEYKEVSEYEELARMLGLSVIKIKTPQVDVSRAKQKRLKDFFIDTVLLDRLLFSLKTDVPAII